MTRLNTSGWAVSIWASQFIGKEIRALNYYEAVGQPLATHLAWMREQGYLPKQSQVWLPHDGSTNDKVYDVSYESAIQAAGYDVTVVPNQGKGAACITTSMTYLDSSRRPWRNRIVSSWASNGFRYRN